MGNKKKGEMETMYTIVTDKFNCTKCNSNSFYLQRKDKHVGVYCNDCFKWLKWVPQIKVDKWKDLGYEVYDENERMINNG